MKMLQVLLLVLGVCGCSSQKTLAHRLKEADCVVVTNTSEGLGMLLTGEEVSTIVQVIAAGEKESPLVAASPAFQLEFFKGEKHLETVIASDLIFSVGRQPYRDTTGTLKALYKRFRENYPPMAR